MLLTHGGSPSAALCLPFRTASVREARRTLARELSAVGLSAHGPGRTLASASPRARDDVVLVLSELVSNAIKHAQPLASGEVEVGWTCVPEGIEVWVHDGGGSTRPRETSASLSGTGGRGLGIVARLSTDWGIDEDDAGIRVWARIPLSLHAGCDGTRGR